MKILCLLLISFLMTSPFVVRADDELSLDKDQPIYAFTNKEFQLNYDFASGETDADPAVVYAPMENSNNHNFNFSLLSLQGVTTLLNKATSTHTITYPLNVNVGATAKYIYVAAKIKDSSNYKVVARSSSTYANKDQIISLSVSLADICKAGGDGCSPVAVGASQSSDPYSAMMYFFLSSDTISVDGSEAITPSSYTGGVYFHTKLSNRIYDETVLKASIDNIRIGDRRLFIKFSSTATMSTTFFKRVIAFNQTGGAVISWEEISASPSATLINKSLGTDQSGEVELNGLTNDTDYELSIAFEDKYQFATELSPSKQGRPLQIQELLKKNACFLLTAGFGEDHFIIDYFRNFRDQILSKFMLGRLFIKTYYELAPKYALMLYEHDSIRMLVRALAYILYYIFNYYLIIGFISSLVLGYFYLRTHKKRVKSLS